MHVSSKGQEKPVLMHEPDLESSLDIDRLMDLKEDESLCKLVGIDIEKRL